MGRKSTLTQTQWAQIERRLIEGESRRALGREFNISESAIRQRMSGPVDEVRTVAAKIIDAEKSLAALPPIAQITARNLATKLRSISDSLAASAEYGARTSHRLNALANSEVGKVDDADPLASIDKLRNVGVLTKLANDSASIAVSLLQANKETIAKINGEPDSEEIETSQRPQITREQWLAEHGLG